VRSGVPRVRLAIALALISIMLAQTADTASAEPPGGYFVAAGAALRGAESGSQGDRGSAPSGEARPSGEAQSTGEARIDRGDTSTFWMSDEAAADSVATFWGDLDHRWLRTRDARLDSFGLDQAHLDSLVAEGDERIAALAAGRVWRFSWGLFDWTAYNRVQGFNPGVSVGLRKVGPNRPRLDAGVGYGFGNKRVVGGLSLDLPLVIKRRQLPHGLGRGRPYQFLALELEGYRKARMFGGDDRKIRYLTSFIYGSDPNQYYQPTGGRALLRLRAAQWLRLRAAYQYEEHEAVEVTTDWNLFNWALSPAGNLPADELRARTVAGGLSFTAGVLSGSVDASWNRVDQSTWLTESSTIQPSAPEQGDFWRTRAKLELDVLDRHGNRLLLKGRYRGVNRVAPTQWRTYLGDYGTLRGYPAGELSGDQGAWASLDIRWGFDLWRALHVPWLKGLRRGAASEPGSRRGTHALRLRDHRLANGCRHRLWQATRSAGAERQPAAVHRSPDPRWPAGRRLAGAPGAGEVIAGRAG